MITVKHVIIISGLLPNHDIIDDKYYFEVDGESFSDIQKQVNDFYKKFKTNCTRILKRNSGSIFDLKFILETLP